MSNYHTMDSLVSPPNDTTHKQAIEQESVNSFIFFFMLNTMGQDCKDEKLSQQLPHKG